MPQLRFPKRDTEGLPTSLADNNLETHYFLSSYETLTVNYPEAKHVYAIIAVGAPGYALDKYTIIEVSLDGASFIPAGGTFKQTFMLRAYDTKFVWIDKTIKSWRLRNLSEHLLPIREVIVLIPDNAGPFLEIRYPESVEVVDAGTTGLDSFANLPNITDGDDNTYASFTFRPGLQHYTLHLRGTFSPLQLASVVSPFVIMEIDPQDSNLPQEIGLSESHAYFFWGAINNTDNVSDMVEDRSPVSRVENAPQFLWSQKAWEKAILLGSYTYIQITATEEDLSPIIIQDREGAYDKPAFLDVLMLRNVINSKTLFVPYFMSFYWQPIFAVGSGKLPYICYPTSDIREPLVYVVSNGLTNRTYINLGLRIFSSFTPINQSFSVKIYGMGFICFPLIDFEAPLSVPTHQAWFQPDPLNNATRDGDESTESPDILYGKCLISIHPTDINIVSPRAIRYRIRSTSEGTSRIYVKRYRCINFPPRELPYWNSETMTLEIGQNLQSVDITETHGNDKTGIIKVEIIPAQ